jgi:hypothetical protein
MPKPAHSSVCCINLTLVALAFADRLFSIDTEQVDIQAKLCSCAHGWPIGNNDLYATCMAQSTRGRRGASLVARAEADAGSGGDTAIKGLELEVCVTALKVRGCKAAAYRKRAVCGGCMRTQHLAWSH